MLADDSPYEGAAIQDSAANREPAVGYGAAPRSVAEALQLASACLDYLNSAAVADLNGSACGEVLMALGGVQAKLTAAHASFLRRFDAANAHDADGHGSSSAWLAAKGKMSKRDARTAVRRMRQLGERPRLARALAAGTITESWAAQIADWTRKLPAQLRAETDRILLEAAEAGASLDDLATIAGLAIEKWRSQSPDPDDDGMDFKDRYLRAGTTFGGAGVIRGDLTPECAAAVTAVLEALGKRRGPEDDRSEEQRFHDALQEACELLIRARMVPDRAGADTQVIVHVPLSALRDLPGAPELEDAWIKARLGEPGYLAGKDAEAAACDALTVPVVTGHADMTIIDKIIALASVGPGGNMTRPDTNTAAAGSASAGPVAAEAWQAHRYAIARLAADFVSGPGGLASALRTSLLEHPYNTPSLPLDIGFSNSIPSQIRRAVMLRDKHCAWPAGCDRPASASDVHHITHKKDGGKTSVNDCALFCNFHHDVCIHRWGWQVILHPDGAMEARSPDGGQVLRSHAPPDARAA